MLRGDASFLMQMRPYRTLDKTVEGVVMTCVDVSTPKRLLAEDALRTANQTLELRVAKRTRDLEAANFALVRQTEERQHAEAMLRQSQKLEAVGKLTGGIAHDFNNLLGVIIGSAEFVLDELTDRPGAAELLREILSSAQGGADLTRRLLAFARQQPLQPQYINLNDELPRHVTMLGRMLGETIAITTDMDPVCG